MFSFAPATRAEMDLWFVIFCTACGFGVCAYKVENERTAMRLCCHRAYEDQPGSAPILAPVQAPSVPLFTAVSHYHQSQHLSKHSPSDPSQPQPQPRPHTIAFTLTHISHPLLAREKRVSIEITTTTMLQVAPKNKTTKAKQVKRTSPTTTAPWSTPTSPSGYPDSAAASSTPSSSPSPPASEKPSTTAAYPPDRRKRST